MSLAITAPKGSGLGVTQNYLPDLVQGEFVSNFSRYSAMSVLDRVSLDKVIAETLDPTYKDNLDIVRLGHVVQTNYIMTGTVTKTASGYALQAQITSIADGMNKASYSGTCTAAELDNLTGIRRASLELLDKMNVQLTEQAKQELSGAAAANQVNAQTALAQGIAAQRQGTEVAALSYYFQAATLDPSLLEAANRSSVMSANISSGNIGDDVRNDIQWRRNWIDRLTETEDSFYKMITAMDPPYTLFYSTSIEMGEINYQTETANLNILINLHGNGVWFRSVQRTLQAVYDGLNATGRKKEWGLVNWPQQGISNKNPFASQKQYDISAVFELVNEQNRVIGRQTVNLRTAFRFSRDDDDYGYRIVIEYADNTFNTVTFNSVKADDISDSLTIRIASVNGTAPQSARFPITAVSGPLRIEDRAFIVKKLTSVTIPDSVMSIGEQAYWGNELTSVTIPNSVTYIGKEAFASNKLTSIVIPDSVTYIDYGAFWNNRLTSITIGANVIFHVLGVLGEGFEIDYKRNGRKAGTYTHKSYSWRLDL